MTAPPLSLKARAIALLAQREHSATELRRKLLRIARARQAGEQAGKQAKEQAEEPAEFGVVGGPGVEDEAKDPAKDPALEVDALLLWLQAHDYLSEERFVEGRIHVRAQRFGLQRIKQELAQHGLALGAAQQQSLKDGELARARAICQRKFGLEPAADAAARAKQMRFLAARGFSSDVIWRVFRSED